MLVVLSLIRFRLKELKLCALNVTPLWKNDEDNECYLITLKMHTDFYTLRKR